ncbi:MAG: glycosyltransferase family 2 protein [Candidatus Omnitrophota bacterium]|nr:glycosyltransferase family 2 protein [Candidatus Omnitrophota bacterium]
MNKISVILITKDEECRIRQALQSVQWLDEIILVDSASQDKTIQIAKEFTDKIYFREFDDFSSQKNFAISKCSNDWVLSLDADEEVSEQLKERIKSLDLSSKAGYRIRRQTYIFKRLMKYGGHSKDFPLRVFDKNKGCFVQPIHEFVEIPGKIGLIDAPIIHYSSENLHEYSQKLNAYTDLEVKFLLQNNTKFSYTKIILIPILRFFQRYLLQRGFLDKMEGFIFYTMSGFYEFLKWSKYWQKVRGHK